MATTSSSAAAASATAGSSVVVAGATGAIGREFILQAVSDDFFNRVVALSRRDIPEANWNDTWPGIDIEKAKAKLHVYAVDWEGLCGAPEAAAATKNAQQAFAGHQYAANLLGSTRKDAGSAEAFHRYDFDYYEAFVNAVKHFNPTTAGTAEGANAAAYASETAAASSIKQFAQISSTGASATSWLLYPRTKGLADEMLMKKGYFSRASIWRPGLLGRKDKTRTVEKIGGWFMSAMPVERVAAAIIASFKNPSAAFGDDERQRKAVEAEIGTCDGAAPATTTRIFANGGIKKMTPQWEGGAGGCCSSSKKVEDNQQRSDL